MSKIEEEEIDTCYALLAQIMNRLPNREITILNDDFTVKEGKKDTDQDFRNVLGKYSIWNRKTYENAIYSLS